MSLADGYLAEHGDGWQLPRRQLDVIRCAARGLSYQQTADELGIAKDTVRHHLDRARPRLGARNTTHAVAIAHRQGLLLDPIEYAHRASIEHLL